MVRIKGQRGRGRRAGRELQDGRTVRDKRPTCKLETWHLNAGKSPGKNVGENRGNVNTDCISDAVQVSLSVFRYDNGTVLICFRNVLIF